MQEVHRVYLVPGMFGFGRLAGYDYFEHVRRELGARLDAAGVRWGIEVAAAPPTASIRLRARSLAERIAKSAGDDGGPIHLVGHSTGGLDARLLATPGCHLSLSAEAEAWRDRLASVVSVNAPHYGTPLAGFFATVSGTRLLYVLSLLTVTTLSAGGPPLTAASALVASLGGLDEALGLDSRVLDRTSEMLLRFIGERSRQEVTAWLEGIRQDQGGIIQITPEGMDLFNAATNDAPNVRYGCLASASPAPRPKTFATSVQSPYDALSGAIYTTIHTVTGRPHPHYPLPPPTPEATQTLREALGGPITESTSDGVVPTRSMLWGELLWAGVADHLDVVGHFRDRERPKVHTDWLASGTHFDRSGFHRAMDAICTFILGLK